MRNRKLLFNFQLSLIVFLIISILIFGIIELRLSPSILAIAETRARTIATEAINKAVKDIYCVQYKDLITIHKNINGQVTLIQINTVEISRMETEITLAVVKSLQKIAKENIRLPLGMATGSKILTDVGPIIKIALQPVGSVDVETKEIFEEAGINQTRHKVLVEVTAQIRIVQPMLKSDMTVKTDIPVAETIIVGTVPDSIINLNKTD